MLRYWCVERLFGDLRAPFKALSQRRCLVGIAALLSLLLPFSCCRLVVCATAASVAAAVVVAAAAAAALLVCTVVAAVIAVVAALRKFRLALWVCVVLWYTGHSAGSVASCQSSCRYSCGAWFVLLLGSCWRIRWRGVLLVRARAVCYQISVWVGRCTVARSGALQSVARRGGGLGCAARLHASIERKRSFLRGGPSKNGKKKRSARA